VYLAAPTSRRGVPGHGQEEGLGVCQDYAALLKARKERASTRLRHVALGGEEAGVYGAAPPSRRGGGFGRQQSRTAIHEVRRVWVSTGLRRLAYVEEERACTWQHRLPGGEEGLGVGKAMPPRKW
jgi:hypothetical protein